MKITSIYRGIIPFLVAPFLLTGLLLDPLRSAVPSTGGRSLHPPRRTPVLTEKQSLRLFSQNRPKEVAGCSKPCGYRTSGCCGAAV